MKKLFILLSLIIITDHMARAQQQRKLVWFDEFNYTGLPDSKKWDYEKGFVRNQEPQYYTVKRLENCRVENGMLVIEARKEQYVNAAYQAGADKWPKKDKIAEYTSASIITKGRADWKYGRMEIRAKVPPGLGIWPAFWMLGTDRGPVKWPNCGEIDIMEFLGRDSTRVHGTVHYADLTDTYRHQTAEPVVGKPAEGFHIYAVEWDENQIAFYYDDLKYMVFDFKKTEYPSGAMFQKNYYLLLNLALGHPGTWAGPLDEKALPAKYYVDYVRVYQ